MEKKALMFDEEKLENLYGKFEGRGVEGEGLDFSGAWQLLEFVEVVSLDNVHEDL